MHNNKTYSKLVLILALSGALTGVGLYGCSSGDKDAPATQTASATTEPSFALWGPPPKKSGAQLWSETCVRCHNSRPPEAYSDAQWDTIVHHMRLRANLTGEECREIVKFLQASN